MFKSSSEPDSASTRALNKLMFSPWPTSLLKTWPLLITLPRKVEKQWKRQYFVQRIFKIFSLCPVRAKVCSTQWLSVTTPRFPLNLHWKFAISWMWTSVTKNLVQGYYLKPWGRWYTRIKMKISVIYYNKKIYIKFVVDLG